MQRKFLEVHTSRDLDALGGHPPVRIGKQRSDHWTDVIGNAGPAERGVLGHRPVELGIVAHRTAKEISLDVAGVEPQGDGLSSERFNGRVTRASETRPYLGMTVEFDIGVMREVMEQLDAPPPPKGDVGSAVFVEDLTAPVVDCVSRLVRMLATPAAIPVLHPSIMREICFWLLMGPHGGEFRNLALPNGHMRRIADAIHVLRKNFSRPIRIKELAAAARMSESSFHQHFRG